MMQASEDESRAAAKWRLMTAAAKSLSALILIYLKVLFDMLVFNPNFALKIDFI
jgi:hypothetical protein